MGQLACVIGFFGRAKDASAQLADKGQTSQGADDSKGKGKGKTIESEPESINSTALAIAIRSYLPK